MASQRQNTGRILIAYDGSPESDNAIDHAVSVLGTQGRTALILTAWESMVRQTARTTSLAGVFTPDYTSGSPAQGTDPFLEQATETNNAGIARAQALGLTCQPLLPEVHTTTWAAIIDAANENDVDLIVTGSRGDTGIKALLHTSVSEHVRKLVHRPLLVVPPTAD